MRTRLLSVIACIAMTGGVLLAAQKSSDTTKKSPSAETQPTKPVNKICPVERNNPIDPDCSTVTYKGQVIGFCCEDCVQRFNHNPEAYAKDLE